MKLRALAFLCLLSTSVVWAQSAESGYQALNRGEIQEARKVFLKLRGEAGQLARARLALTLGRPLDSLRQLQGDSVATRVIRLKALCRSAQYSAARRLLRKLETEAHGSFEPPFDFEFYLMRGLIESRAGEVELARKNIELAIRRAQTPDQKCQAYIDLVSIWLRVGEMQKAEAAYSKLAELMQQASSVWILASHFDVGFDLEYEKGNLPTAAALNRASREMYKAYNNPVKAADALVNSAIFAAYSDDALGNYSIRKSALAEYLAAKDYHSAADLLRSFKYLYFQLGSKTTVEEFSLIYQQTLAAMPTGLAKDRGTEALASFLSRVEVAGDRVPKLYRGLIQSSDPRTRSHGHQGLALHFKQQGQYDQARSEYQKALVEARDGMMIADRDWRTGPGPILLDLARLARAQRRFTEALEYCQRAIDKNPGQDWTFWRIEARHISLMTAVEGHELESAKRELSASLVDIERLSRSSSKASALTTILSALLVNQSVGDDVLEPAELLMGAYSDVADTLLKETFADPNRTARFLTYFNEWQKSATEKDETGILPQVLIYKGLFFEALGQLEEATLSLNSGLEVANQHKIISGQMLSQLLLARVAIRQGKQDLAADYLTKAAAASLTLNPKAGRFYSLLAGATQRDGGRPDLALVSFTKAIELQPEKAWSALYGRARVFENQGRFDSALEDLDAAIAQIKGKGRRVSAARLLSTKARVLFKAKKFDDARSLFAEAHGELLSLGSLDPIYRVTMDYSDCLTAMKQQGQALDLLSGVLDQLSKNQVLDYQQGAPLFEKVVALSLELGEQETALRFLQLSHSAELLESVNLSAVQTGDPETKRLLGEVSSLKTRLVKLQEQSAGLSDAQMRQSMGSLLAQTRQEFFAKLNELKRTEPDFEAFVQLSGSQLSSIQDLLSPQSVLIEYFPAQNTLYLFVVTKTKFSLHQVSISRSELQKLVDRYLQLSSRQNSNLAELREASGKLRRVLIDSLGPRLDGISNLRLVPSGPLWNVSFSSLLDNQAGALVKDYEVSYITSSDLARIRKTGVGPSILPKSPLLVSGAQDLLGAESEIQGIAAQLAESLVLSGSQISKKTFLASVQGKDLIHIASHSRVSLKTGQSYLELGGDRLALEEVYGLPLEPSSLVVLSSCRSGVGADSPGKEVTSLASAFSIAGASTVIASRWKVDDRSTAEFFKYFYAALLRGRRRGQAFREAELEMAKRHSHPYYWAGFTLIGDPD